MAADLNFETYIENVRKVDHDYANEHSYRTFFENLMSGAIKSLANHPTEILHEAKQVKRKAPDFRLKQGGQILGYIETKKIGENLDKIRKSSQIKGYLQLSPNILLTDYLRFVWIKNGEVQADVQLTTLSAIEGKPAPLDPTCVKELSDLLRGFLNVSPVGIGAAKELAVELATRCRLLRDFMVEELIRQQKEEKQGRLNSLYQSFKTQVFSDLKLKEFADAYAQTLGYGLFLAKFNAAATDKIDLYNAKKFVPQTFRLLRELVDFLDVLDHENYKDIKWVVEEIMSLINGLDLMSLQDNLSFDHRKVHHRIKTKSEDEARLFERDPYIYFYEDFLNAYDSETRESRGVYYTPPPVVNFIVRTIDNILVDIFEIKDGLADRNRVTVLDFACGTGTFLLEIFQQVFEKLGISSGKTNAVIRQHLLRNMFGFEFLIAPYTIAHLKLSQFLEEKGHPLQGNERLQVFLTNTLEPIEPQMNAFLPALSEEAENAQKVKDKPILVITGNPPYSGHSRNKGKWIKDLINTYKFVDGKPLGERNSKWLQDDYVKFVRFAQHKMAEVDDGIIGIITNHSFLDNPTFRGMRQSLMKSFDQIYLMDLHGNSRKKEKCPEGSADQNVFDIEQGVSISFFVKKLGLSDTKKGVFHSEIWGSRLDKYKSLFDSKHKNLEWEQLEPVSPFYLFVPQDTKKWNEYNLGWPVTSLFIEQTIGLYTARDSLTIQFKQQEVSKVLNSILNETDEDIITKYNLPKDGKNWSVSSARQDLKEEGLDDKKFTTILYRPFDMRNTYYTGKSGGFMARPRGLAMKAMLRNNIGLVTSRQFSATGSSIFNTVNVTDGLVDLNFYRRGGQNLFPIYFYDSENNRHENFSEDFREFIDEKYDHVFEPEEIFNYIYAVLHAQEYREVYNEFLRIDFPRIPFCDNRDDFEALSSLGSELVTAHLMRDVPKRGLGDYKGPDNHTVEERRFQPPQEGEQTGKLYINKNNYFDNVPHEVWEFQIGGYQVLDKYLKDRKNRTLSLDEMENVENIVNILDFTREQMQCINTAYQQAFSD
jgi:predicted helicase